MPKGIGYAHMGSKKKELGGRKQPGPKLGTKAVKK